ncbi:ABC transporter ATP-binding protein [Fertoebacter nigrum]|uniref:ABC transporter ATP-binding protein n=1 Tax=Fertoeibacter niger TaxID=2656921 RepID=A0A8X8H4N1_9RHOB|nr:ATP-binding cassette domain-containing protein [Fertoeibacter niger]NUB45548.1 ABC transporter ATP-binding protein [Fertoeibacter niger]
MTALTLHLAGRASAGDRPVFGPLALDVPGGRWTCLLGPSGVGKSTLLRLLAGLSGGVRFDGQMAASDGLPLAGRVALMAQDDLLLPWLDCAANVMLGARLRGLAPDPARARALLADVGLAAEMRRRPAQLSGGQRQRVALARTLMEDRPVVLLDEPFSALDARSRAGMQDLAARLLAGRTVLMVTHDPAEAARLGDRLLLLTGEGLQAISPPAAAPPRRVDDPATLALQGRLMVRLMAA